MNKMQAWIKAFRLRTLPLSVSGILIGAALAAINGFNDPVVLSFALLTTILFQLISNLANDLGDSLKGTDNEHRIGPERTIQSGLITIKEMKIAIVIMSILAALSSVVLIYFGTQGMPSGMIITYAVLAVACIVAAITYTVGGKAYGYYGLGDLMVLIFFGFVSVLGVYSLIAKEFLTENILPAIFVGLLSTAVLNLNNMRDYKNDEASGKNTFVVRIGPNFAKFYHVLIVFVALFSMIIYINRLHTPSLYLSMVPALYMIFHLRYVLKVTDPKDFDPELKKVALTTFAVSLLFFLMITFRIWELWK